MDYLLRLNPYVRLAILLCLSLCVHLTILFSLSWSSFGARQVAPANRAAPLTVTLPSTQPIATNEKSVVEKAVSQNDANINTDTDKPGNKFALSNTGLSLAIDLHYFSPNELDERPFIIQDIPSDPPELQNLPQGGKLALRLWINEDGKVIRAEPVSSELPQAFIDSARSGFLNARFAPGRIHGNAVASVMDVVLLYAPKE
ncbi:MAG: hypothetical protein WA056_00835 [Gallionella sp.]